jgi:DNA-binding NarL/FixJ family response regulator
MTIPDPSCQVYPEPEDFVFTLAEPLPLDRVERVLIGKWDALYAEALRRAVDTAFPGVPVAICRRGDEVLAELQRQRVDLALLGLTFADRDGVDVVQAVAGARLATRLMIVSGRKDEVSLHALRQTRFDGFFDPLAEDAARLVPALRAVAEGRGFLSETLRRQLFLTRSAGVVALQLTATELQVLGVIGDGSDDREAAERLQLSDSTVQTHRRNLMRKLGVGTSAKLVREAVRLGVVRIRADGAIARPGWARLIAERGNRKG